MTDNALTFGAYLRWVRDYANLSGKELATAAGISAGYLSDLERGNRDFPSPEVLQRLATVLKVPYEDLGTVIVRQFARRYGLLDSDTYAVLTQAAS